MTIRQRDEFGRVGIPSQFSQEVAPAPENLMTGDTPGRAGLDFEVAENQNLETLAVVGLDRHGRLVRATYSPVVEFASGALTLSGNAGGTETVTIDGVVYTFVGGANAAYQVTVGADEDASAANLAAAINASGGAYGAGTEQHPSVYADAQGPVVHLRARQPGSQGNAIATVEAMASGAFGSGTLTGGFGGVRPIGIIPYPIETAAGENPVHGVWVAGVFNPERLVWDASFGSDRQKRLAFLNAAAPTNIIIRSIRANTLGG